MDYPYIEKVVKIIVSFGLKSAIQSIKLFTWWILFMAQQINAQNNKDAFQDTTPKMNLDAVYDRPFLTGDKFPIALGGYMEVNTQYESTDGIAEGLSFQARRFTLFISSEISEKVRFLSELEYEDGTKEVNIEFAAVDYQLHPLLNLRGGIILNPIGAFNQNHDGPKWEFTDRPLVSTEILPATWSNAGMGFHGKWFRRKWTFAYEIYASNGFDERIVDNDRGYLFLPATKLNRDRFEESFNGMPLWSGKWAVRRKKWGELGLSYMGGTYNRPQLEGESIDVARKLHVYAIDYQGEIPKWGTKIIGEVAWVEVQKEQGISPQIGSKQWGFFMDMIQPIYRGTILGMKNSLLQTSLRVDYIDRNSGQFIETGKKMGDEVRGYTLGLGWRPNAQGIIRLNYTRRSATDFIGNPPALTGIWQFGISTYF